MRRNTLYLAAFVLVACDQAAAPHGELPAPASNVVARFGNKVITVDDVQEQLNRREAFLRARYSSPEKRKEFLDTVVRFELLADEALKKGYQNDPDIIRMYKQWLVSRLVQKDFDPLFDPAAISEDEVRSYYEEHKEEFRRPARVVASEILIKTESLANKVADRARKLAKDDGRGFTEMVLNFSEDTGAQQRGGEFILERDNNRVPQYLVDAVFGMKEPGEVIGPIKSDKGFHIIRMTKKQDAELPALAEVEGAIRGKLNKARHEEGMTQWVNKLKAEAKLEVFEDKLAEIKIDPDAKATGADKPGAFKINPALVPGAQ